MADLLRRLIDALGPSGYEQEIRVIITKELRKYVDEVRTDKFGNLIARKKGKGAKVMLAAHMDEIGLMINKIESNGFIRFSTIGGIEPITLIGQKVTIIKKKTKNLCNGIISMPELHEGFSVKRIPDIKDLYVDTGLNKKELAKLGVEIGDYIVPMEKSVTLGNKKIICGKALDDRIGCYILIEVAKMLRKSKADIYYTFTVQEEVGLYGAKVSVYQIDPDWGIAVDATNSQDSTIQEGCVIGSGPYITVKDAEMLSNIGLIDWLKDIAKKKKIPVQLEVSDVGTTDATSIMLSRRGVPSTVISIPIRNLHSTIGVVHLDDINNAIKLLYELLKNPPDSALSKI